MRDFYRALSSFCIGLLFILSCCEDESAIRDTNIDIKTGLRFISSPVVKINVNQEYNYMVRARDNSGNDLIYVAELIPSWLSFNDSSHALSGRPTVNHVGYHHVIMRVSNQTASITQSFTITVNLNTDGQAWSVYTPFKWSHDGMPYYSDHCRNYPGLLPYSYTPG